MSDTLITYAIRVCPWWLLYCLIERYQLCPATVVTIKLGYNEYYGDTLRPQSVCWGGPGGYQGDYCGRYETWAEFHAAEGEPIYIHFASDDGEHPPAGRLAEGVTRMEAKQVLAGFAIVVLDRGFVYVGDTTVDGEWCLITDARNIRRWGTTKGLGELALSGPQAKTQLDAVGTLRAPLRAVISIIDTDGAKWSR